MIKNNMTRGVSAGALAVLASACGHLPIAEPAFEAMSAKRAGMTEGGLGVSYLILAAL